MVVVAPDPYSRAFVFPGYQNVAFFAWHRGMGIPRAQEAMCVSMGADECVCRGRAKRSVCRSKRRAMRASPGEERCVPRRALIEVCVCRCKAMCISFSEGRCVCREAAECCVRSSGIEMIPPSRRSGTMRALAGAEQCLSAGAERSVFLMGSGGTVRRREQRDVCVGRCGGLCRSGRKGNVD